MNATQHLSRLGESLWLDIITRNVLTNGTRATDTKTMLAVVKALHARAGIDVDALARAAG